MPRWAGMQPFMGEFSYINICRVFPLGLSISLGKNLPDSWLGYEVSGQLCEILTGKGVEGACAQILDSLNPPAQYSASTCSQLCWKSWNSVPLHSAPETSHLLLGTWRYSWFSYKFTTSQLGSNSSHFRGTLCPPACHWNISPCFLFLLPSFPPRAGVGLSVLLSQLRLTSLLFQLSQFCYLLSVFISSPILFTLVGLSFFKIPLLSFYWTLVFNQLYLTRRYSQRILLNCSHACKNRDGKCNI